MKQNISEASVPVSPEKPKLIFIIERVGTEEFDRSPEFIEIKATDLSDAEEQCSKIQNAHIKSGPFDPSNPDSAKELEAVRYAFQL